MSNNHQQVIKSRSLAARETRHTCPVRRDDPFSRLVAAAAADPDNPFNIERYMWVLEEPPVRPCGWCGVVFDPWSGYGGEAARGCPRRYCSRACRDRAAWTRRCRRVRLLAAEGRAA